MPFREIFFNLIRYAAFGNLKDGLFYGLLTVSMTTALLCGMLVVQILREPEIQNVYVYANNVSKTEKPSVLSLIVADNFYLRFKGLSDRRELQSADGMIFIYPKPRNVSFVMRDMNFHLDIAFVNDAGSIVDLLRNIPSDFEGTIDSMAPVSAVVEIPSSFPKARVLEEGTFITSLK